MLYFALKEATFILVTGTLKFLDVVGTQRSRHSSEKLHPVIETWQAAVHWMLPVGFARLKSNISMKSEERNNIFL